jgi:Domain of unknown function (DUF4365)
MASYENELIESADFRADLSAIGLNIARPRKILVFGRDTEFIDRPHDWELLQHQFRTNQITHYTVDHILRLCERVLDEQWGSILSSIVPPDHLGLLDTGNRTLTLESLSTQLRATEGRPTEISELIWNVNHNKLMESLTLAHVQTIVSASGLVCSMSRLDDYGVDLTVYADARSNGQTRSVSPGIDIVLKATSNPVFLSGDDIRFPIHRRLYDELRAGSRMIPVFLFVTVFPKDPTESITVMNQGTSTRIATYWISLEGSPEIQNRHSVVVRLPRENLLTPVSLRRIVSE